MRIENASRIESRVCDREQTDSPPPDSIHEALLRLGQGLYLDEMTGVFLHVISFKRHVNHAAAVFYSLENT